MVNGVMVKLVDLYKKTQRQNTTKNLSQLLSELKPKTVKTHKGSHGILVKGEDDIMVKLAKCCNPIYGDEVFGFTTINSGITIHRHDCPNALRLREKYPYRILPARWQKEVVPGSFRATVRVQAAMFPVWSTRSQR